MVSSVGSAGHHDEEGANRRPSRDAQDDGSIIEEQAYSSYQLGCNYVVLITLKFIRDRLDNSKVERVGVGDRQRQDASNQT
jgi:hypothetical protein